MAPGRKAGAINSGDSGNPGAAGACRWAAFILFIAPCFIAAQTCLDAYDAVPTNILAALCDTTSLRRTPLAPTSRLTHESN
ncbi:unnamed protein product [Danaus chrysippus]|uniref:(African queen) hypothetical protein n=1 Tax=Danaus chrysippus TaxID=151541 RepID=A0A8J2QSX3_9NEOP|nr:unnamed protein product [Danaus chrysippus]